MLISILFKKTNKYILLQNAYTFFQTKYEQYENSKSNYARLHRGILMLDVFRCLISDVFTTSKRFYF